MVLRNLQVVVMHLLVEDVPENQSSVGNSVIEQRSSQLGHGRISAAKQVSEFRKIRISSIQFENSDAVLESNSLQVEEIEDLAIGYRKHKLVLIIELGRDSSEANCGAGDGGGLEDLLVSKRLVKPQQLSSMVNSIYFIIYYYIYIISES